MSFEKFTGTRPVAPQHAFGAERLAAWMREHVDESAIAEEGWRQAQCLIAATS